MQKPKFSSVLTKRALVGLVILIILSLSTAFAADWEEYQVTSGSCPGGEEYIILELADDANSHVQLPGESSSYTYKLCLPESNEGEVIPIPDGSQYADLIRQCRGRNQVLSLFTPTNSHVESPEIGDYYEDLCFGFFENCRIQDKNIGVDGSSGEVFLAWASDQSNAHLFEPDASPVGFDYRLVCNVPFCGSDEIGDIYPILFDFEEESDVDFKIHNLVKVEPDLTIDPVSALAKLCLMKCMTKLVHIFQDLNYLLAQENL
jgi:hypothetical protein